MQEQKLIKATKRKIRVLKLSMDIPYYEKLEDRLIYGTYESTLLKLFNNKRENKEILEIRNYYDSNTISIEINLTDYLEGATQYNEEELIDHLKNWFRGNLDIKLEDIKTIINTSYLYEIDGYTNDMDTTEYIRIYDI